MKITRKDEKDKVIVDSLPRGAVFQHEHFVCMKMRLFPNHSGEVVRAMFLDNALEFNLPRDTMVTPLDAELIVRGALHEDKSE